MNPPIARPPITPPALPATADAATTATDLGARVVSVLRALPALGVLRIETMNDAAAIVSRHEYAPFHLEGDLGRLDAIGVLLRLRVAMWGRARAVNGGDLTAPRSIEFVDARTRVIHRVHLADAQRARGFDEVIGLLTGEPGGDLARGTAATSPPLPPLRRMVRATPNDVDQRDVRAAWFSLVGTGDGGAVVRQFGVTRGRVLKAIGHDWARQVDAEALGRALAAAAAERIGVAITVGNEGCTQTCWGPWQVECAARSALVATSPSARVVIHESPGSSCWVVREPRADRAAWCLEAHDGAGDLVLSVDLADPRDELGAERWTRILEREA